MSSTPSATAAAEAAASSTAASASSQRDTGRPRRSTAAGPFAQLTLSIRRTNTLKYLTHGLAAVLAFFALDWPRLQWLPLRIFPALRYRPVSPVTDTVVNVAVGYLLLELRGRLAGEDRLDRRFGRVAGFWVDVLVTVLWFATVGWVRIFLVGVLGMMGVGV